jgi:DNA-binding CsgD family transcriptional regulator
MYRLTSDNLFHNSFIIIQKRKPKTCFPIKTKNLQYKKVRVLHARNIIVILPIMNQMDLILANMTERQRRRYRLYLKGKTYTQIAIIEGISQPAAYHSIKSAEKRVKKRLKLLIKTL